MSTSSGADAIGTTLFGKTQRALLALFFMRTDAAFYLRQVVRMAGVGQGAAQRELARWVAAGLLLRNRRGQQVYYHANVGSPVFEELRALAVKTTGLTEVLRDALAALAECITVAFVHGSMARGTPTSGSDVDVIVIGDVAFGDVVAALQSAQRTIGREVNPIVYSEREFRDKLRAKHHFVSAVMDAPRVFVVGGEHELKRLAESAMADRALTQLARRRQIEGEQRVGTDLLILSIVNSAAEVPMSCSQRRNTDHPLARRRRRT